jgi:hypothetical protein
MNNVPTKISSIRYAAKDISSKVPLSLQELPNWIAWNVGQTKPDGKFDKLPIGKDGSGNLWQKPHQWMTFDEALNTAMLQGYSGVGIVLPAQFSDGTHLVALDYDDVDLSDHPKNLRLQEIKSTNIRLGEPYVEESPSGKGLRMFVRSINSIPQVSCMNQYGGKDELFCASGKWTTVTGWALGGAGIPEATEEINLIANTWQANATNKKASKNKTAQANSTSDFSHLLRGWDGWPEQKIKDGDGREEMMLAFAGHLRGKGFDQQTIERLCLEANQNHYEDQLDDEVVLDRARRYETDDGNLSESTPEGEISTGNDLGLLEKVDHTDAGNVAVIHNLIDNKMRYLYELNKWIVWKKNK